MTSAPVFPPEEINGWSVQWVRADFGMREPEPDGDYLPPWTGLAIITTRDGRLWRLALRQDGLPEDIDIAAMRASLLAWFAEARQEIDP